ncbi:MAG: hypothetical protein KBT27_01750, partial [Prevotellaceae bacterium]|nr:hypothetical protein [Candidatus Faecinaster equi]
GDITKQKTKLAPPKKCSLREKKSNFINCLIKCKQNKHHSAWWLSALTPYSVLSVRKYTFDIHPEYIFTYFVSYPRRMALNQPTCWHKPN